MSKIGLIIGREFNQRVRKRTFILTTVLLHKNHIMQIQ